jgi:hypothetical protein
MKAWVELWDRREPPHVLAVIRMLIAAVVVVDLAGVYGLDLVETFYASSSDGGLANLGSRDPKPLLYRWLPLEASTAWWSWCAAFFSAVAFGTGTLTRLSGLIFVLASANLAQILPPTDRAIDILLRNMVLLLSLSSCHRVWSVDALIRCRRWSGDPSPAPAWPRFLIIIQLFIMYFTAGVQKVGLTWTPVGDWSALYIVLRDPAFAVLSDSTLDSFYRVTQLATISTWLWEWSTPLAAYALWSRATRGRPGHLRAWLNASGFWFKWVVVGACFHLGIATTMRLGMFPYGVLALYPAFFSSSEWRSWLQRRPATKTPPLG